MDYQQYEIDHINKVRELSPECMVMLKSDNSFPLEKAGQIALYGSGARHTLRGGSGGGIVEVRDFTTIEQGLLEAGFEITTITWLDTYDDVCKKARDEHRAKIKATIAKEGLAGLKILSEAMPEPDYDLPLSGDGDTAIYVLARISGEGADRSEGPGDIRLTETEIRDIFRLAELYDKFMLVLNVSGIVDLSPVVNQVKNIFLLSQTGTPIGAAFADVLLGRSYPSGKLASTWAKWESYSKIGDFGNPDDTRYIEGIYVGYRYFDTIGTQPLFPFGFGLSYTTFSLRIGVPSLSRTVVTIPVTVLNNGERKGKEVAQLYVSVPEGKLDQPYQVLAAFGKTNELVPGESETIILSFDIRDLASYDEDISSRIIEKGYYHLRVGSSSRDTVIAGSVFLGETVVVERLHAVGGKPDFHDWRPSKAERVRSDVTHEDDHVILKLSPETIESPLYVAPLLDNDALELAKTLSLPELVQLCTGSFDSDEEPVAVGGGLGSRAVPGAAGETTSRLVDKGVPRMVMSDGPAGIHISKQYGVDEKGNFALVSAESQAIMELMTEEVLAVLLKMFPDAANTHRQGQIHEQYCTAIPIETALAQSWNPEVSEACGEIVAKEMEIFGIDFFLAPALNTHRNPLCGRNFEYFSEDPLISGKMAAGIIKGVQKDSRRAATLKHFVCNEQETNRLHSNSQVSERALREIYMRPFEIAVKEAPPHAIMSSYNLLNGEHTSQRFDLMETVLREEWGFQGIVMSDWVGYTAAEEKKKYPRACASGAIKAGNDIMMPGYKGHYDDMMNALTDPLAKYPLTRENLEKCASRMIAIAWKLKGNPSKH